MDRRKKAILNKDKASRLNKDWSVGAVQVRYSDDGHWYATLLRFPAALFDRNGYLYFASEEEYHGSSYLSIGKQISIPKPGISAIPGYVRVLNPDASDEPSTQAPVEDRDDENLPLLPEEMIGQYVEGATKQIQVNAYKRSHEAREKCLKKYGRVCVACRIDLGDVYGEEARGYVHVHHLYPLSASDGVRLVDPIKELRPLCPNCHAVAHLTTPPLSIEEIQNMIARRRESPKI